MYQPGCGAPLDVSVVIPTWNTCELLAQCLDSITPGTGKLATDTIVVDNGSTDGTASMVRQRFPWVSLICNETNGGFAKAANQGVRASAAPYALVLNSDARLLPGTISAMLHIVESQPDAGIVGPQLRNPDGTFQASYARFPTLGQQLLVLSGLGRLIFGAYYPSRGPEEEKGPRPVDWVSGACMLVRRAAFDAVGGFDESYFMYAEEMDLCYRLRTVGWQTWYHPAATAIHIGGASSHHRRTEFEADLCRSRVRFFRTHHGYWSAALLRLEMYAFTAVKIVAHGLTRWLTGGRYGRRVVPLRMLRTRFRTDRL
jgi:N-acetylglucosaminyl-diphospho-decaprenol L-rhamnosyltransferase